MHIEEQRFTDGRMTSWATEAEVFASASLFNTTILIHEDQQLLTSKPQTEVANVDPIHVRLSDGHLNLLNIGGNLQTRLQSDSSKGYISWFEMITSEARKCLDDVKSNAPKVCDTTEPETHVRAERIATSKTVNKVNKMMTIKTKEWLQICHQES